MARTIPLMVMALCGQFLIMAMPARAAPPTLRLPISCTPGSDCFIQQYVDADAGPGARDYTCGAQTYDGHQGTDIRIRTTRDAERGVAVLAAAPGTVVAVRDGEPDRLARSDAERKAVARRECGNGVVIDHGDGWQTQYCHMRQGSLAVAMGDAVVSGERLGEVGYSGLAAFAHVHITVRRGKQVIDPFTGVAMGKAGCGVSDGALWASDVLQALAYRAGAVLDVGFAPEAPEMAGIEEARHAGEVPASDWPVLVAWGWAINLERGDEVAVSLAGPDGVLAENRARLDRHKAQYLLYAGKRRPAAGWTPGRYVASFAILRDGKPVLSAERPVEIK